MNDVVWAFTSIERNGIKVSDDICDIFDMRVKKHISNGKLYSNYTIYGQQICVQVILIGTVNSLALPPEKRRGFIGK